MTRLFRDGSPPAGQPVTVPVDADLAGLLEGVPEAQAGPLRELIRVSAERAWRLQHLQSVSSALSRTLNESEVVHELARAVHRAISSDGVFVARPDLDQKKVQVLYRLVDGSGVHGPAAMVALEDGAVAQAARTGEAQLSTSPSAADRVVAGDNASGDGRDGVRPLSGERCGGEGKNRSGCEVPGGAHGGAPGRG